MTLSNYYHGFELDIDSIGDFSISKRNIELGYNACLPYDFDFAEHIRLCFNIQASQPARILLIGDAPNGLPIRATVSATDGEIKTVLHRFFHDEKGKTRFDCGLTRYWLGVWQAHFREWCMTRHDYDVTALIRRMEPTERDKLLDSLPLMGVSEQYQAFAQHFLALLRKGYGAGEIIQALEKT